MRPSNIEYLGVYMTKDQIKKASGTIDPSSEVSRSILSDRLNEELNKFKFRPKYIKKVLMSLARQDPIKNSRPLQCERLRLALKVPKEHADVVRGASKRTGMSISSIIRILIALHASHEDTAEEGTEKGRKSDKEYYQEDPKELRKLRMKALDQALAYDQEIGEGIRPEEDRIRTILDNADRFYDFMAGTGHYDKKGRIVPPSHRNK